MSACGKCCMRPGPITSNGYLNFLRIYRKKKCGMSPVETVRCGAKAWNRLSCAQKARYRRLGCKKRKKPRCPRKRKRRSCPPKRRRRRCPPKRRKSCPRKRRRSCRPKKRRSCRPKKRKCPRRRRRPSCGKKKCMRPGPVTNNGYLNFLRWYRKCNCGLSPTQTIRRGARKWCSLTKEEKDRFNRMACRVSKSKRKRRSALCRRC